MRVHILSVLLLTSVCSVVHAQRTIRGRVINSATKEPIAYANIGISRTNVGTISNADGSFSIIIPAKHQQDSLAISSLGFGKKTVPVKLFIQDKPTTIYLNEKRTVLQEVVVKPNKSGIQLIELGNKGFNGAILEADTTYCGRSLALLINPDSTKYKNKQVFPAYLEKAHIMILRNNQPAFKLRLRLNEVDPITGGPGKDLLEKSIVKEFKRRMGWVTFDLSGLNHEVTKPFYVTFEQIVDLEDRIEIADGYRDYLRRHPKRLKRDTVEFEGKKEVVETIGWGGLDLPGTWIAISSTKKAHNNHTAYTRQSSFAEWKEVHGIITATVTVSVQKDIKDAKSYTQSCKKDTCIAQKLASDFIDDHSINGMQIAVSKKNKLVWTSNLGYADIDNKIPVTDSTRFRINSISKSMTSLALIKLLSENKIDLDAPVETYVKDYPKKPYSFTTRQLAGHLAGFRDYKEGDLSDYVRREHYNSATEAMQVFKDDTLLFEPGTAFHYSSFGWNLIGAVIESISGQSYLQYMQDNIWRPLGLNNTCGDDVKQRIPNRARFYDATGEENDLGDLSYKYPGGGLLSTATDLVKMGNELLHGKYFDPSLRKMLYQTQHTSAKTATGYGLGWYTGKDKNGRRIWYHGGDSFSGSSYLIIYPDEDIVIAFLANSQEGVLFNVQEIAELFYKN